jgi:large subunit ribosomal protein L10
MSKAMNAALIDGLHSELQSHDSCVLVGTARMTVQEITAFRKRMREHQVRMRVVKNALAEKAFDRMEWNGLGKVIDGPAAVLFGTDGAIAISKVIVEEKKTAKDKLVIHVGWNEGEALDSAGIEALSKVPGRHELLGMTLAALFGPVSDMARNMDGLFTEMQGLIEALAEKNKED